MDSFFIEYRDPMFGIITLVCLILMIAALSFVWGIFRGKDERHSIEKFVKKFESSGALSNEHKQLLASLDIGNDTLSALAKTFVKNGDYEKAISVYLVALDKYPNKKEREFILTNLGKVYFKAGFLERSSNSLMEALKLSPRNEEALRYLTIIYENLKRYKEELDALDALREQGVETSKASAYVRALIVFNDATLKFDDKVKQITTLGYHFALSRRLVLELFIKNKEPLALIENFPPLKDCIDILWYIDKPVNLQDPQFRALFYARNLSPVYEESEIFEINLLSSLRKSNFCGADLSFNYICKECKNTLPMFFYRCPICHAMQSAKILPKITEISFENSNTF